MLEVGMIHFDDALDRACQEILSCDACHGDLGNMLLIRDINGRLSLLIDGSRQRRFLLRLKRWNDTWPLLCCSLLRFICG